MMIRYLFVSAALLLLNACTGLGFNNTGGFSTRNTVGRNIDEVMAEFSKAGLRCSGKGLDKEAITNKLIGRVRCGNTEKGLFCPKSFFLSVSFDIETNKVASFGKGDSDNCF